MSELLPFFERLERQLTWDCGKPLEEIFECFSTLQIVEQRLDRYPGSAEDWCTVHDVRIADDRLLHRLIVSQLLSHLKRRPWQAAPRSEE